MWLCGEHTHIRIQDTIDCRQKVAGALSRTRSICHVAAWLWSIVRSASKVVGLFIDSVAAWIRRSLARGAFHGVSLLHCEVGMRNAVSRYVFKQFAGSKTGWRGNPTWMLCGSAASQLESLDKFLVILFCVTNVPVSARLLTSSIQD